MRMTAEGWQSNGMSRGYDEDMLNPVDKIKEQVAEIKHDVQVEVQIFILTQLCKFCLSLLSTLNEQNPSKYTDLADKL